MQSQQKRVKWSRGETAEALEERTDTGITSASVELMENCIPDIYGNISRRPALKLLSGNYAFTEDPYMQVIPFYITETDYILVAIHYTGVAEFIRVTDGVMVYYTTSTNASFAPHTSEFYLLSRRYKPVSYAQQNNYMIIADAYNMWKLSFTFGTGSTFTPSCEVYKFTADWYAPSGTQTKTETSSTIPGLMFSGDAKNYTVEDASGGSTVYTSLPTGLDRGKGYAIWTGATTTFYFGVTGGVYGINTSGGYDTTITYWTMTNGQTYKDGEQVSPSGNHVGNVRLEITEEGEAKFIGSIDVDWNWVQATEYDCSSFASITTKDSWSDITIRIPAGSIVKMPTIGCYFRVEGYFASAPSVFFPGVTFDKVTTLDDSDPLPSGYRTGAVCVARTKDGDPHLEYFQDGDLVSREPEGAQPSDTPMYIQCRNSTTGGKTGSFYYGGHDWHFIWEDTPFADEEIFAYGSLLTPIADSNATDSTVSVEYGYISLTPTTWHEEYSYPHPRKVVFNGQRLWAGAWDTQYSADQYSIVIGSQIGRYNDFKNDYNQENEPITLDILTQYKEKIFHLIDYNGLKIMTDSYEYAYDGTNGVAKQSANGSFEYCEPIVFDSLCLYIDSTGQQVKAMQYEFQSNIFNSSTINQVAPHDLVWYPWNMAQYEDKYNSTGKYLFLVNREDANARLAVCNFVPSNQANIWSRWTVPTISYSGSTVSNSIVHSVVNLKGNTLFMIRLNTQQTSYIANVVPAMLDFSGNTDFESSVYTAGGVNYFCPKINNASQRLTACNTQVAVYADGVFQWFDTTTSTGALTKSIAGLTNVTVGLPINSTIISHPIDVGGKTKSIKKRIGKARMSVHGTEADVITINGKTGYMNPAKDQISFYGVTGMKNEIKYTITNKNGGMFHLESLLINIEYGTLDS